MPECKLFNQNITDFFKALGNEKRQEILLNIFTDNSEHNITEVADKVKIAQSTASEHLSLLKRAGILVSKKIDKEVYYKLSKKGIINVMDELKGILSCCPDE
jgi:DNA-binding transcriptional ArsR family regulator